jgi:hypothetical protein
VAKLGILPPNVPIPSRWIVTMKMLITINNLRREKLETKINSTRKRKISTAEKIVVHLT